MQNFGEKWFTRQNGLVKGPFTLTLLNSNVQQGRLLLSDEASQDQRVWLSVQTVLDNAIAQAASGNYTLEERDGFDRRNQSVAAINHAAEQRQEQRRRPEPFIHIMQRQERSLRIQNLQLGSPKSRYSLKAFSGIVLLLFIGAILFARPFPSSSIDCNSPVKAGVNWENCILTQINLNHAELMGANLRNSQLLQSQLINANLEGANLSYADLRQSDLSYANLQNSNLKGSQLQQSTLFHSQLTGADLSFADLRGAQLDPDQLENVILDRAIWIDGRVCATPSYGQCN